MTDAETTRNADELWALVRLVQETINKDGSRKPNKDLAQLRKLADELDPENGQY